MTQLSCAAGNRRLSGLELRLMCFFQVYGRDGRIADYIVNNPADPRASVDVCIHRLCNAALLDRLGKVRPSHNGRFHTSYRVSSEGRVLLEDSMSHYRMLADTIAATLAA